jgi:hypothetical protein
VRNLSSFLPCMLPFPWIDEREKDLGESKRKTSKGSFLCLHHGVLFRRTSPPVQATSVRDLYTVAKPQLRSTLLLLEPFQEDAQIRRHLCSKLCPENVFQFSDLSTVTRPRLPTITANVSVHLFSSFHLQTNPGTSTLLKYFRSHPKSAQLSCSPHFKNCAETHLQ